MTLRLESALGFAGVFLLLARIPALTAQIYFINHREACELGEPYTAGAHKLSVGSAHDNAIRPSRPSLGGITRWHIHNLISNSSHPTILMHS
ncbi:hypothetical protein BD779DRAFT_1563578 [Infundibulicybe gibba]|nr:hypothetical protein BD779DRAFT_1563578 [Infundibulicybe gibba]